MNKILVVSACIIVPLLIPFANKILSTDPYEHMNASSAHYSALILARGGSKGIVLKNLAQVENVTLVTRALTTITRFGKFNSVWVSTDSPFIENESLKTPGVQVHRRSPETATDTATSLMAVLEFLSKHEEIDIIALIQCTSPFLKETYLDQAYNLTQRGHHSVFSLTRQHKHRWKITPQGLKSDNFRLTERMRRQDWAGELVENGMFYFSYRELIQRENVLQGGRSAFVEIPQRDSLEIDTEFDLKLARLMVESEF